MRTHPSSRLIVTIAFVIGHAAAAAAQSFDWARQAGGPCDAPCNPGFHQGSAIAVDADGNTLVTGRINGTATFGAGEQTETTLPGPGISLFIAKYDVHGSLVWARQVLGDAFSLAIAVDPAGNSYVAGGFRFAAAFPGVILFGPASGVGDMFIAKYDAGGSFVWARQAGTGFIPGLPANGFTVFGIAVDSDGSSRVTGVFGTPTGGNGFFAARYDAGGNRVWVSSAAGDDVNPGAALGAGVTIDAAGNTYVAGDLAGSVTFGFGEATETTLVGSSLFSTDFFVAKYDANGAFVWARRTGNFGDNHATGIAADTAGNIYVTGQIDGTVTFSTGSEPVVTFTTISNDMFVARYDSGGSLQWARHVPGLGIGGAAAIAFDGSGGIHVAGGFVASITFAAGELNETVLSVVPGGSTNPFVARYNTDGSFVWARSATGAIAAAALGVAAHPTGTSITGYFRDFGTATLTFGAGDANETTLTTTFGQEIFVARYTNGTPPANRPPIANAGVDQIVPVGSAVTLDGGASSDPDLDALTYQWTMTVRPANSHAVLQNPTSANPTFVADVPGIYRVDLVVSDGPATSAADSVVIRTENRKPIANAGPDQTADTGVTIQLNGSVSTDPDGDTLTFSWSLTTVPPGSTALLSNPSSASPTFVADRSGVYVARLIVSDGTLTSDPDTVTITVTDPDPSALPCGGMVSGTIAAVGEIDVYTFNGRAGQIISLALASTGGFTSGSSSRSAALTLFAPSGAAVGPTLVSNSQSVFTLPVEGVYTVRVRANNGRMTGSYNISGECLTPVRSANAVPLACDALVSGTIAVPGETDLFTLTGSAGDIVSLALASTGGFTSGQSSRSVVLTVFAPSGAVVGPTLVSNGQSLYTLPADGVYALRVSANNLATTGSYNLGRQCLFPPPPDTVQLPCGALTSGTIAAPGDTDLLSLIGQAGQIISLALASTGGFTSGQTSRSAVMTLFAPSGAVVGTLVSNSQNLFTLPVSGAYAIRVSANNLSTTGSYNISRECLSPARSPDVVPIACDALVAGTIGVPGDTDLLTFTGQAGAVTALALASTGGFATRPGSRSVVLTLFAPSGGAVGATLASNSQGQYTLPVSGDYTIRVSANNLATTGSYTVRRTCP